jgi:hypothetical protein
MCWFLHHLYSSDLAQMAKGCCEDHGGLRPSFSPSKRILAFAKEIRGQVSRPSSSIMHKAG